MAVIYRPAYCTREEVRRAVDIRQAAYADDRIDRAIQSAADSIDGMCRRVFYPSDATHSFDWPNFDYSYVWRLWLSDFELAAAPVLVTSGSLLPAPIVIPSGSYILRPVNAGPPYTSIELRRDKNVSFGNNSTPQLDIAIKGTFGYWTKTNPAGTLSGAIGPSDTKITVSDPVAAGVGDVLVCGTERMLVTDSSYVDMGISFSGFSGASANDNVASVPDGTRFVAGEVIMVDSEWILVQDVIGNNLICKRGWDGSVLASHSGGSVYGRRSLTVVRGALGTTGSASGSGSTLSVSVVPALIRELAIAESLVLLSQEPTAYGGASAPQKTMSVNRGGFGVGEAVPGAGLPDLRAQVMRSKFVRQARSRAI